MAARKSAFTDTGTAGKRSGADGLQPIDTDHPERRSTMQAHQPQGSDAEAITKSLTIGAKVSYTVTSSSGRSVRISAREGTISEINGEVATVKARNGRTTTRHLSRLTPEGQPNELTRALMGGR
jgi:hypothetical protein